MNIPFFLLTAIRMCAGVLSLLIPETGRPWFGLPHIGNPDYNLITRLFGIRDLCLSAFLIFTPDKKQREIVLKMGMVCDAVDTISGIIAFNEGVSLFGFITASGGAFTLLLLALYLFNKNDF
jgi:hypothetical protein